eukprot:15142095-Ditylum_brightwellii.AAC.1
MEIHQERPGKQSWQLWHKAMTLWTKTMKLEKSLDNSDWSPTSISDMRMLTVQWAGIRSQLLSRLYLPDIFRYTPRVGKFSSGEGAIPQTDSTNYQENT